MGSISKTILVGRVGNDPDIRTMQSGDAVASFQLATSERWTDKDTNEQKERVEWHRVAVFDQAAVGVIERYCKKGSQIGIEGKNETRSYEADGVKKYVTEVVVRTGRGRVELLDTGGDRQEQSQPREQQQTRGRQDSGSSNRRAPAPGRG